MKFIINSLKKLVTLCGIVLVSFVISYCTLKAILFFNWWVLIGLLWIVAMMLVSLEGVDNDEVHTM